MALPSFMSRSYVRLRYPLVEDHGNTVPDTSAEPSRATFYGSIQPGTGTRDTLNRNGAEVVKTIWSRPGADLSHLDHVELPDGVYFVNGAPEDWDQGILDHLVVRLSRWEG